MAKRSTPSFSWRLRHILPYYRQKRGAFILGFLLLVVTNGTVTMIPYIMKLATEALSDATLRANLPDYALLLILVALINALVRIRSRTHIFAIGRQVEYELRKAYHAKLLALDVQFFTKEKTGDLVARGSNDVLAVRMFIGPGFLQISNTLMAYAVTLPVMISLDPYLTLLTLAPFPLVLGISRLLTKRLYHFSKAVADRFGSFSGFVQEAVVGVAVIRSHAREDDWQCRLDGKVQEIYHAQMQHAHLQSLFAPIVLLAGGIGAWIILLVGGQEVMAGRLTVGDFVAFSGYLAILVWPTVGFGWILTVLQRGLAALERIGTVLDTEPFTLQATTKEWGVQGESFPLVGSRGEAPGELPNTPRGRITIHQLTFPAEAPILKEINIEIAAGCFIGLAGRVGSGKTTLLNCLTRLYPVAPATIFLDGRDLMTLPEAVLRQTVAMAQQESFLFSTTIRDNLCLGRPASAEQTAWEVAEMAAFAQEIRGFPQGLSTLVGERGITLSGGQRQRLALARALLMEPAILLLDDIFASVDARTEAEILNNIQALAGKRTIIMVCHRTQALHRADQIYLLERGQIVAHGDHATLLQQSPLYCDLHRQMARAEALESLL